MNTLAGNLWHTHYRALLCVLLVACFLLGLGTAAPQAQVAFPMTADDHAAAWGGAWIVERFAGRINRAINAALRQHQAPIDGATKVVPIMQAGPGGSGLAVGGAQVMGPPEQVAQVQAVAEVPTSLPGALHARGLIPVSTRDLSTIRSVSGVSVSATVRMAR